MNGRPLGGRRQQQALSLKEGSQVRLECQSGGGRPAPRIEWLNVSWAQQQQQQQQQQRAPAQVQLLRALWPHKKAAYSEQLAQLTSPGQPVPVTSSSVTISLSRFDLSSQFVCLVLAGGGGGGQQPVGQSNEQLLSESAAHLAALLEQRSLGANSTAGTGSLPMLKWIKFDVQG